MFDEEKIFSVTQFNTVIKTVLNELGLFKVKGEITEFTITQRKGVYMTISDGKSNLKISGYAPKIKGIDLVEKGMNIIVTGYGDVYVPYGSLSFSATAVEPEGEGDLAIAYQKLKEKLEKEGLFAVEHKQELPKFITKIALLTGKDSAAYSDFTKILFENKTGIEIDYYPVIVQGENSVPSIMKSLEKAVNQEYDVIVLTRGGGSLEDLKSFNDEDLARKIFNSPTPFLVGVGHEKDESISDFVADLRASTPSQCAYYLIDQNLRFVESLNDKISIAEKFLTDYVYDIKNNTDGLKLQLENFIYSKLDETRNNVDSLERVLKSYDIQSTLNRGFAIVRKGDEQVSSVKELSVDDEIGVRLKDGEVNVIVQ